MKHIFIILLIIGIAFAAIFFNWQAYVQVIEIIGGEPSIPAFIGWILR